MNTREQFGKYTLLKKLTEDALGETFRAGLVGSTGMERVTLLRVFNGQGLDGPRLWEVVKDRQGVQGALRSPSIGEGVEMGQIQGIPYVAYEYVSGKNMASLLEQAARQRNFIPTEHALLITERVALALAAASENRLEGARILHGFLIPQLTMVSNEGETRLLGFEMSPGLRGFAANPVIRQHFGRYLSPEALAGAPPDRGDDIYSLGVFLFELLTGRPLPPPASDGYASVIDQGVLATAREPIPDELRGLLKKTLVARAERLDDVVAWHKTINSWMFEGQYNPTTFNLAFYMHNLFRQDIERENQEIEVETTLQLPVQAAAAAAAPPAAVLAAPETVQLPAEEIADIVAEEPREERKSKKGLFLGLAAAAVVLLAAGGYYLWSTFFSAGASRPATVAAPPPPSLPPPAPPEEPEGPSPEEIQEQIRELIAQETSTLEEQVRAQYEKQLKDLESELTAANRAAEKRRQQELERQRAEEEAAAALVAEQQRAEEEAAQKKKEEEAAQKKKAEEEAAAAAAKAAEPEPLPPPTPPPPPEPQVRRGDLVEIGPGVKTPEVLRLIPRFPEMARRLRKAGATVTVKALVDENGRVLDAELVSEKVGFGFDTEALQAVKKATFKAATKNGVPVKFWHTLNVQFKQP